MLEKIYPIIQTVVVFAVMAVILLILLRLLFSWLDPNPFGKIGRIGYKIKRATDKLVKPAADFLFKLGMPVKIAPFLAIIGVCIFAYFVLQLFGAVLAMVAGIADSAPKGEVTRITGYLLAGFLGIYSLMIVMRIVFSWFVSFLNPVMKVLLRATDPILVPFRKVVPPLGAFDISPMIVLLILWFLQTVVATVFLSR